MFDPIELAKKTEKIVSKGYERKYYRFRGAKFYGGIATGDCVGCCLRCVFCWGWNVINKPERTGEFYTPEQVASKLVSIAEKAGFSRIRISGNEPTINKEHLLKVIKLIPQNLLFILETNGILIGHDEGYAKDFEEFKNLHVRVSLKGSDPKEFSKLTGSKLQGFEYQLKALENLEKYGISYHPAVIDLVKNLDSLNKRIKEISPNLPKKLEIEPLIEYPQVTERIKRIL